MDPGVALPELEPVPERKRDIPSGGIEGSFMELGSWLLKAGEPEEPSGVMVAEMLDTLGSALCLLRSSRRCDTSSPSNGWEYLEFFCWLSAFA